MLIRGPSKSSDNPQPSSSHRDILLWGPYTWTASQHRPQAQACQAHDFHSLFPSTERWTAGWVLKALRPTSRNCIPVSVCVCSQASLKGPEPRLSGSCDFHRLLPFTGRWTARWGLKALRPAFRNCILAFVWFQAGHKAQNSDPVKHKTSTASFSQGGGLLDRVYNNWDQQAENLGPSILPQPRQN
jgi:hypothetical protein